MKTISTTDELVAMKARLTHFEDAYQALNSAWINAEYEFNDGILNTNNPTD